MGLNPFLLFFVMRSLRHWVTEVLEVRRPKRPNVDVKTAKNGHILEVIFRIFYFLIFIFIGKIEIDWKNSESDSEFFHIFVGWYKG
jgi:hypothetical protein